MTRNELIDELKKLPDDEVVVKCKIRIVPPYGSIYYTDETLTIDRVDSVPSPAIIAS